MYSNGIWRILKENEDYLEKMLSGIEELVLLTCIHTQVQKAYSILNYVWCKANDDPIRPSGRHTRIMFPESSSGTYWISKDPVIIRKPRIYVLYMYIHIIYSFYLYIFYIIGTILKTNATLNCQRWYNVMPV